MIDMLNSRTSMLSLGVGLSLSFSTTADAEVGPTGAELLFYDAPAGTAFSIGLSVSEGGLVMLGLRLPPHTNFRWTPDEGAIDIPGHNDPGVADTIVMSSDGRVVAGSMDTPDGEQPFLWSPDGTVTPILNAPGITSGNSRVINHDGTMVLGRARGPGIELAYVWTAATGMTLLQPLPGGLSTEVRGVTDDGSMIAGSSYGEISPGVLHNRPVIWDAAGVPRALDADTTAHVTAMSASGSHVFGRYEGSNGDAFRWSEAEGFETIGDFYPRSATADGSMVLSPSEGLWTESEGLRTMHDIIGNDHGFDLTGRRLGVAFDISDDGRAIVGASYGDVNQAFLFRFPPPDGDADGVPNVDDNCPEHANSAQTDTDGDGKGDACDACVGDDASGDDDGDAVCNDLDICIGDDASQDSDSDGICDDSDACRLDPDNDADGDGVCGDVDACVGDDATGDSDGDDVCDDLDLCLGNDVSGDEDTDGICDDVDNCPTDPNPDQLDADGDEIGDVCEADGDADGVIDDFDNCVEDVNPDQSDADGDGLGDPCDPDDDNDGVDDPDDNCPLYANSDQADFDGDGYGDLCDGDDDADGVGDGDDSCPGTPLGALFDEDGCSGAQLVELHCGVPEDYGWWQSRYVMCVIQSSKIAQRKGLLTRRERGRIIRRAVWSQWQNYRRRLRRWC